MAHAHTHYEPHARAPVPTRYASFDMGVKNLALCIVEVADPAPPTIVHWELINTLEESPRRLTSARNIRIEVAVEALVDAMRSRAALWEGVAEVVIEQQPVARMAVSNTLCKCLSHVLQAHFYQLGARVRFCSPKLKLGVAGVDDGAAPAKEKAKDRYARHKRAAIDETRRRVPEGDEWRAYFESKSKKDDLADAFLQALVVIDDDATARAKAAAKAVKAAERAREAQEKEAEKARKAEERVRKKAEKEAEKARKAEERARKAVEAEKARKARKAEDRAPKAAVNEPEKARKAQRKRARDEPPDEPSVADAPTAPAKRARDGVDEEEA